MSRRQQRVAAVRVLHSTGVRHSRRRMLTEVAFALNQANRECLFQFTTKGGSHYLTSTPASVYLEASVVGPLFSPILPDWNSPSVIVNMSNFVMYVRRTPLRP
jgi:hypothetical protein